MIFLQKIDRSRYCEIADWTGGQDRNEAAYTYSDGAGSMSQRIAQQIAIEMRLGKVNIPSCIQSRFRGYKGIHVVNPRMDELRVCLYLQTDCSARQSFEEWAEQKGLKEDDQKESNRWLFVDLRFRKSQNKFAGKQVFCCYKTSYNFFLFLFLAPREHQNFEVVKLSGPSRVCLNRPMINILDQVSCLQSPTCHQRIRNRVLALLDLQLRDLAHAMVDEASARARLGEFPHVLHFDKLQNVNLTGELFWRSLLQAATRCTLSKLGAKAADFSYKMLFSTGKLRNKLQIAIPASLGRSMLGVIDENRHLAIRTNLCSLHARCASKAAATLVTSAHGRRRGARHEESDDCGGKWRR